MRQNTDNLKILSLEDLNRENYEDAHKFDSLMFVSDNSTLSNAPEDTLYINNEIFTLTMCTQIDTSVGKNKFQVQYLQKWYSSETYAKVMNGKVLDKSSIVRKGNIIVYEKIGFPKDLVKFVQEKLVRGQTIAKCSQHTRNLVKVGKRAKIVCQEENCRRKSAWRCPYKYGRHCYCTTSLCRNHMLQRMNTGTEVDLPYIERPQDEIAHENEEEIVEEIIHDMHVTDEEPEDENALDQYVQDVFESPLYYGLNSMAQENQCDEPLYVRNDTSKHGFSTAVDGALVINHLGTVRPKLGASRQMPVMLQSFLQSLFSSHPDTQVSIVDFEALVFPQIFPFVENESAIGALPISMLINPLVKRNDGIANLMQHLKIRTLDQTILTSQEPDYTHFVFNIMVNSLASYKFMYYAIKKGVEFLKRPSEGIQSHHTEASLLYDTVETRSPAVELGALCSEHPPGIFFTFTCNQKLTPGVGRLCRRLDRYATKKAIKCIRMWEGPQVFEDLKLQIYNSHLGTIMRLWDRTVRAYERFLIAGEDPPFGKIKARFRR